MLHKNIFGTTIIILSTTKYTLFIKQALLMELFSKYQEAQDHSEHILTKHNNQHLKTEIIVKRCN